MNVVGIVRAICISKERGTPKQAVERAECKKEWGIVGDAHAGQWHRQVSLISAEKVVEFQEKGKGAPIEYGAFGENIVVEGLDFGKLPVGTLLRGGDVLLEMTQIGKECHSHCSIFEVMGDCIMPREGVFAKVIKGGVLQVGDRMEIEERKGQRPYQAAVLTLSDKASKGERIDESGPILVKILTENGYEVQESLVLPDEKDLLRQQLIRLADQRQLDLILTTGGTGLAPRDITPEVTLGIATKQVPGIAEAIRYQSMQITKRAMLSRGVSVIRGKTLIVNLPGSPKACKECVELFLNTIPHGLQLLRGERMDCGRV